MLIFLISICLADEPAKDEQSKEDDAPAVTDPAQVADQLSDILAMLQAIPTDTTADDGTAPVETVKADTKTVEEKAK